jgi:hypothetical protein
MTTISDDEVDFDSGFLMLPSAVSSPATTQVQPGTIPPGPLPPGPIPPTPEPVPPGETRTAVDISFAANRDQLFAAWNAIANLADMAGEVNISIHAEKSDGFDKSKLQNGVIEPLRESDLLE